MTDPTPSKADQVHAQLKQQIELGELAPGAPLSELWLVERTGASRTPVREALRRLAAEGLVDLTPRLGARVSRVSAQSVRNLFEFRQLLEPAAIRQATEAATADPAVRDRFAEMRAHFARIQGRTPSPASSASQIARCSVTETSVRCGSRCERFRSRAVCGRSSAMVRRRCSLRVASMIAQSNRSASS